MVLVGRARGSNLPRGASGEAGSVGQPELGVFGLGGERLSRAQRTGENECSR